MSRPSSNSLRPVSLMVSLFLLFTVQHVHAQSIASPDGTIALELTQTPDLNYRIQVDGEILITDSPLRLQLDETLTLGEQVKIGETQRTSHDSTWSPVVPGRFKEIRDHYNEMTVSFTETSRKVEGRETPFQIIVRVFNDGVAFRYRVNNADSAPIGVMAEGTHFRSQRTILAGR